MFLLRFPTLAHWQKGIHTFLQQGNLRLSVDLFPTCCVLFAEQGVAHDRGPGYTVTIVSLEPVEGAINDEWP
jgi:hypothetical protein